MTRLYLDTEFTELTQHAQLLSIGMIDSEGRSFYAELQHAQLPQDDWLANNVLCHMNWLGQQNKSHLVNKGDQWQVFGSAMEVTEHLQSWLSHYQKAEVWADCVVWDWLLFCELFGGAFEKPPQIHYLPFDLVTLLLAKGVNPDINRRELAVSMGLQVNGFAHHALDDAKLTGFLVEELLKDGK